MSAARISQLEETWDAFLAEWPISRLRTMTLPEYTAVGQDRTFRRDLDRAGQLAVGHQSLVDHDRGHPLRNSHETPAHFITLDDREDA